MCYFPTHPLPAVCLTTGGITGELYGNCSRTCSRGLTGSDVTSEGERAPSNPAFSAGKEALCSPPPRPSSFFPNITGQIRDADVQLAEGWVTFRVSPFSSSICVAEPTRSTAHGGENWSIFLSLSLFSYLHVHLYLCLYLSGSDSLFVLGTHRQPMIRLGFEIRWYINTLQFPVLGYYRFKPHF